MKSTKEHLVRVIEELGIAKCKLSLDLFSIDLKLVPEDISLLKDKFEVDSKLLALEETSKQTA